ncbi:family 1 glycosylhydrolase [Vibrio lentus]|nr:family 1 glycosylhydrolase [Vibrio lentus]
MPPIYITENGAAGNDERKRTSDGRLRVRYFQGHIEAVHNAVEAGVKADGYFAWSPMDNF